MLEQKKERHSCHKLERAQLLKMSLYAVAFSVCFTRNTKFGEVSTYLRLYPRYDYTSGRSASGTSQ